MSAMSFSHAKDADLSWVEGQIHFANPSTSTTASRDAGDANSEKNAESKELNLVPTLVGVPSAEVGFHGMVRGPKVKLVWIECEVEVPVWLLSVIMSHSP